MKKWITPFAYVDGDALHVCADKIVEAQGWPLTDENLKLAARVAAEWLQEHMSTKIPIIMDPRLEELS